VSGLAGSRRDDDGPPPIGGSWRSLYAIVVATLLVLIALFYAFTKAFE
jgi:hypothetical protein